MRKALAIFSLAAALILYGLLMPNIWESRGQARANVPAGYIIPSKFSRILALGNQGLLSDFLFLKTATFIGGRSGAGEEMSEEDWQFVIRSLDVVTDLDPYFTDPYVLAEGLLAWEAQKPDEANKLLAKGALYRNWDWRLPFYIGFNHFYFLRDHETASGFIMDASRLAGSPSYLPTLGARLAYYGGQSKTALLFLKEMLADTDDPLLKKRLNKRLVALEQAVVIEKALAVFKEKEGCSPSRMVEMGGGGYLESLPIDPYGGRWGILKNGRVYSTSQFVDVEQEQDKETFNDLK